METYFDLGDPGFDVTSEEVHRVRDRHWYVETNYGWAVLRYAEGAELLKDKRFRQGNAQWPAQNGIHSGPFSRWWSEVLLSLEGEDHARIRRLLMPAFRNRTIAAQRPRFQALANELIDAFAERGEVEFVGEFAEPYAARILCILLGLPEQNWLQLAHWADDLGKAFGVQIKKDLPRIETALSGLYDYVDEVIADRGQHPGDDLVTGLLEASTTEGRLTREELRVTLVFLAFGGMETTRNQLGLAMRTLLEHPDQWRLLGDQPELGERAVEEVMRVNPTVTWISREAIEDVDFHGLHIPAGGIVQVLSHSVGTDPSAVDDPSFDITQLRTPHLGFGAGVHHCLGHFVARTDMSVALPLLAQRMRDAVPDGPGEWLPMSGNTGPVRFPIKFRPEGT